MKRVASKRFSIVRSDLTPIRMAATHYHIICFTIFISAVAVTIFIGCSAAGHGIAVVGEPSSCLNCTESIISGSIASVDSAHFLAASIKIVGTGIGVAADTLGRYSLPVPNGSHRIRFEYPGYYRHEVPLRILYPQRLRVDVRLEENRNEEAPLTEGEGRPILQK